MSEEREVWVPVMGVPHGRYEVSSHGLVRSLLSGKERILKGSTDERGYQRVILFFCGTYRACCVHSLVMENFVGPRPRGLQVCHTDGNPRNNRLANLRYDTPRANCGDKVIHGTYYVGEDVGTSKLTKDQVLCILGSRLSGPVLADSFGISEREVRFIRMRKRWGHIDWSGPVVRPGWVDRNQPHPTAKLTRADILDIRNSQRSGKELAGQYSVSEGLISNIRSGFRWKKGPFPFNTPPPSLAAELLTDPIDPRDMYMVTTQEAA